MQIHQLLEYHDQERLTPETTPEHKERINGFFTSRFSAGEYKWNDLELREFFKYQ